MTATQSAVRQALSTIDHPVIEQDIVSLGLVRDVSVSGDCAQVALAMNAPFAPAEQAIGSAVHAAIEDLGLEADISASIEPVHDDLLPEVRNVLVVAAGKGGVGKTTVAVNLAAGLADRGARVGLLDADVHGPNVPRALPVDAEPDVTAEDQIVPPTTRGVSVISMGMLLEEPDDPVILRGPMLNDVRTHLLDEVAWGPLDYLVVDLPPGTGDGSLDVLQTLRVTGTVLVTTPHPMARDDARKAVNLFRRHGTPLLGVVENMQTVRCPHCDESHAPFGDEGVSADRFDLEVLGELPVHPAIGTADEPVAWDPANPCYDLIDGLVDAVADRVSVTNTRRLDGADTVADPA